MQEGAAFKAAMCQARRECGLMTVATIPRTGQLMIDINSAKDNEEIIGYVRYPLSCPLKPWNQDPDDYYLPIEATIIASIDEDVEETAGELHLVVIKMAEAINDHVKLYDVFDACSADLEELYHALFNAEGAAKEELRIECAPACDILYIDSVKLVPKYASTRLFFQALEAAIATLASQGLTVAYMRTLDLGGNEWTRCGFEVVPGTDIVFRDNVRIRTDRKAY
jgi:hypothetical protein